MKTRRSHQSPRSARGIGLNDYQKRAQLTDQNPGQTTDALIIPLLGLAGETAGLLSEYKKLLRDGPAHARFGDQVEEELGDVLWYVANVATKSGLTLSRIAAKNLSKTRDRFLASTPLRLLDEDFPAREQLPRHFKYEFAYRKIKGKRRVVLLDKTGRPIGDPLTDNAYYDDGYRFHDVLHLSYAALLGWSPVTRRILGRKRRSRPEVDEVEDGGRARVIEEGIAASTYEYAFRHNMLAGVTRLDWELLRSVKRLTANLEVRDRTAADWWPAPHFPSIHK